MFDSHTFQPITFWSLGPLRNPKGVTIAVAEIDETWILKWREPWSSAEQWCYCSDYRKVIDSVKLLY
jgi:hypothetical protein